MLNRYIPIYIFPALLLLAGCGGGLMGDVQNEQTRFLREKSAEIGSKDVVMFDIRRRATEKLIEGCHRKKANVEAKIDCVNTALKILDLN